MTDRFHVLHVSQPTSAGVAVCVRDLATHFPTGAGLVKAVDGVSFDVHRGAVLGLVGVQGVSAPLLEKRPPRTR